MLPWIDDRGPMHQRLPLIQYVIHRILYRPLSNGSHDVDILNEVRLIGHSGELPQLKTLIGALFH